MSWWKTLYKFATGRTFGKSEELKLRYESAQKRESDSERAVQTTCRQREEAQEAYDEAVDEQKEAIKKRKARVPSSVSIHPI